MCENVVGHFSSTKLPYGRSMREAGFRFSPSHITGLINKSSFFSGYTWFCEKGRKKLRITLSSRVRKCRYFQSFPSCDGGIQKFVPGRRRNIFCLPNLKCEKRKLLLLSPMLTLGLGKDTVFVATVMDLIRNELFFRTKNYQTNCDFVIYFKMTLQEKNPFLHFPRNEPPVSRIFKEEMQILEYCEISKNRRIVLHLPHEEKKIRYLSLVEGETVVVEVQFQLFFSLAIDREVTFHLLLIPRFTMDLSCEHVGVGMTGAGKRKKE